MYFSQGAASEASRGGREGNTTNNNTNNNNSININNNNNNNVDYTTGTIAASTRLPKNMTFEVNPQEICFRDFKIHNTYEASLQLKNVTKETQFVRVAQPQSRFIQLKLPKRGTTTRKVASGLTVIYKVLFTPEENRDYNCDLIVTTDHEEFTIPVQAISNRGKLALPNSFTVSPCPVKGNIETTLFLRNTELLDCQWRAEVSSPFKIIPSSGIVPRDGGVLPVNVIFNPLKLQQYNSVIIFHLGPEEDVKQELPIFGNAIELNVILEQNILEFPNTFVTLERQAIVRVHNDSNHTVQFTWKSERNDIEEIRETEKILLDQSDILTYAAISNSPNEATRERLKVERIKNLTKGGRVFDDDVFTIEPINGVIYAKGIKEFVVTFNPQLAMDYIATAYLEISGKRERLPLQLKGIGMGPQCELEFNRLDIGDIFIGALHEYEVAIINKGCIEARYSVLLQDTLMGKKFKFNPSEGVLAPGTQQIITIQLKSDLVGLISEIFKIHLHGSLDDLTLRFRGRVTGPSLEFDMNEMDFGNVSYNCLHSRKTQILNTGQIPIKFNLRIPNSSPLYSAITIIPSEGIIQPQGQQEIRVDLYSNIVGDCQTMLLVDVDGVGIALDALPIKAACLVPSLYLSMEQLHYGTCFVGHEYIMNLEVVNKTALFGKYEVILLNEDDVKASNALVVIGAEDKLESIEIIAPRSRSQIPVKLTPLAVGALRLTLYVRVLGSEEPPLPVLVTASARGPTVTVEPKSISFGTLMLLENVEKEFILSNTSPITAFFKAHFINSESRNIHSVFKLQKTEGEIPPFENIIVRLNACLDDARQFIDKIQITVRYAEDDPNFIDISALGKGYALVPTESIEKIDFGDVFTETQVEKQIMIKNEGRRDIEVLWSGLRGNRVKPGAPPIVFKIIPENATINAGSFFNFTIQSLAEIPGIFTEEFVLKDKKVFKPILTSTITGNFVTPMISYSTKRVVFDYIYGAEGELGRPITMKTFTMKNTTTQSLQVILKCVQTSIDTSIPFELVEPISFNLASGETHIVGVNCDACYRRDRIAHSVKSRVLVSFANHPFTEYISLVANIAFPTIRIEPEGEQINFGSILADTEGRSELILTNLSPSVTANFTWSIESNDESLNVQHSNEQQEQSQSQSQQQIQISSSTPSSNEKRKYFDFIPFRGTIPPGGRRVVEAVFYGARGRHEAIATCLLEGGPSSKVLLVGWSDAVVRFDCTSLDLGVMPFYERGRRTICISSPARVAVPFSVDLTSLKYPGSLTVTPLTGVVTNKVFLNVIFTPVIPEEVVETFYVQVGHLDPQPITVRGFGHTSSIMLTGCDRHANLIRSEDDMIYNKCLEEISDNEWVPYYIKSGHSVELQNVNLESMEAERRAFCHKILLKQLEKKEEKEKKKEQEHQSGIQRNNKVGNNNINDKQNKEENIILSRYIIDFGHMTRQETRTTKLKIVNTSIYSVALVLDKKAIESMPLQIEPMKIPTISPFTEIEVNLTLFANDNEKISSGANKFGFFLDINKGPRIMVEVRCFVATPILTPCETVLDFGDVLIGHVKKIPFHLANNEVIPCTWKMALIETKRKEDNITTTTTTTTGGGGEGINREVISREAISRETITPNYKRQFKLSKERGTLPPTACLSIKVSFMSRYRGPAKAKIRLTYASNPEQYFVTIKANVIGMDVIVSPSQMIFPAALPSQAMRSSFTITNNEDRPVEVFSMNLDRKYKVELNILDRALMINQLNYNGGKELHLPPREAGEALPEPLLEAVFNNIQEQESLPEYQEPEGLGDISINEKSGASRPASRRSPSSQTRGDSPAMIQRQPRENSAHSTNSNLPVTPLISSVQPKIVIITGPPFSGKTTQIQHLLKLSDILQLDLDAMIQAEAEFDTAEGEVIRNILSEKQTDNSLSYGFENTLNISRSVTPTSNFTNSKVVMVLYSLLTRHLSKINVSIDIVVDDVKCILTNDKEAILFAIERAASSSGRSLQIISLGVTEATTGLRRYLEIQKKCQEDVNAAMTNTLSEEEYEQLSEEERDIYNRRLLHYNKCKKALAEASKEVIRFSAQLEENIQQTVQAFIDTNIIAKEEQEVQLKSNSKSKKNIPEPHPKPMWNNLSDIDQYKELYILLRRGIDGILHDVIEGENEEEFINNNIITKAFPSRNDTIDIKPSVTLEINPELEANRRADFSPDSKGYGVWEFIDEDRVKRRPESFKEFRFFSTVQREAIVKKAPKGTLPQLVSAIEETTRWIVPPKSSIEINVIFCSEKIGQHSNSFIFGITGTSQEIIIPVLASIAYPEINRDERTIFTVTKPRSIAGRQLSRVFLTSKRTYEFGPLIVHGPLLTGVQSTSTRKGNKRMSDAGNVFQRTGSAIIKDLGAQDTMTFTNTGIFPAEVSITFGREKENTFTVTPNRFTLPVGEKMKVTLRAVPDVIGEICSTLIVLVRDNPTPWYVNVSCIGTRPAVTLDGKKESIVQYGRCLITRQVEKVITIANASVMPVRWRISGVDKLPKEFELNPPSGILDVNGIHPMEIIFKPIKTGIHNVQLKVEVTDSEDILFESLPLTIKAEAHDAVLEWTRHVDFKLMHVGETKKEIIRILNKSPYEVGYMLRLPKILQNLITLTPSEGILRGLVGYKDASLVNIEVTIKFEKEGEIPSGLGIIEAAFFEPTTNELLYPLQSIPVNGEAWYNRFTIKPSCIDFGSCFVDQKKQCSFELRNTGQFPLSFRLFNYKKGPIIPTFDDEEGTIRKPRKSTKSDPGFQLGAFIISPSIGTVGVGDNFTFQVVTVQDSKASYKETLGIYVDYCEPEIESKGVPFELVASPTMPGIVADLSSNVDVETVFEEQQVVMSLAQCHKSIRAYARENRVFSFGAVLVGSRIEERFRIANSSPLTCMVKLKLIPKYIREGKDKEKKEKEGIINVDGFELLFDSEGCEDSDTIQLPSFESRFVTVCFAPPTLQQFSAKFEAVVVGATNPKNTALRFELCGEGILPTVEYILPPKLQIPFVIKAPTPTKRGGKGKLREVKKAAATQLTLDDNNNSNNSDTIQLPTTLIGMSSKRSFTVRNTGEIAAHIRLTAPDETLVDINISKLKEDIILPVGGEETFDLIFTPSNVGKKRVRLRVSVTENPYEDRELWVLCESYFNSISFDNVDPASEDNLTFGYCYVGQPKEHIIALRNNSPHTIRFEWDCPSSSLEFNPLIGHLSSGSVKQISIRLFSDIVLKETVHCIVRVTSIEPIEGDDWDSTKTKTKWVVVNSPNEDEISSSITATGGGGGIPLNSEIETRRNLRKVIENIPEPLYNTTNEFSIQKNLYVSYSCEYTSYKVTLPMNSEIETIENITFPLTKIFQKRTTILRVTNTGLNILPYSFEVSDINQSIINDISLIGIFNVEPSKGEISPQSYSDIRITFAPRSIEDITQLLIGNFLHSQQSKLYLPLHGSGECPLVHFNVPKCDYLSSRIDGEAGLNLHPDTIPIMFYACGLQSKSTVSFKVINPTSTTYRFEWIGDTLSQRLSPFRCLTPSGSIAAGKQCEMSFDYTATSIGIREAKWSFFITGQTSIPFLLVGKSDEPNVFLHVSKINFGGVTVGNKNERIIELENREDVSFPFSFDKASLDTENSFVGVRPMNGIIPAKSTIPLYVWFCPKDEISVNVKLFCRVKRVSDPLTINVKGEGLRMHSSLRIEDDESEDAIDPLIIPPSQTYHYSLGRVQVDTIVKKRFILSNDGLCTLNYNLIIPEHRFIELSPISGTIAPKQRSTIMFVFAPTGEENLRNFKIQFKIEKTIVYSIRLSVTSYIPKLSLSFYKYDFGPCFITEFSNGAIVNANLSMINGETKENITLDCMLSKGDIFDLDATSFVLSPGEVRNVKISFTPHEVGEFTSELKIILNGSYPIFIPLTGEGIIPRIELPIRFLKLGIARIGERRTAELRLECKSRAPTPISLANCVDSDLQSKGISFSPNDLFIMRPKEVRNISVSFKPTARMPEFQREVRMIVCGQEMPLAILSASCEDAEVHLDVQNILFDDVVVGTTASRRIVIMNSGDISQRFKWDLALIPNSEMKVIPATGLVRAHAEQTCEFLYNPKKVGSVFKRIVTVEFDNALPLSVNVEAHGVERPKPEITLEFTCKVKTTITKNVPLENPTDILWSIRPTIDSKLWSAPKLLQINPKSSAMLPITYTPMLVTREKDLATLFIPLPVGTARTIQLEGIATPSTDSGIISEKIVEANTPIWETFEIENVSTQPLRFYVNVNWNPEPERGTVNVKTPVSLDVPARQSRECRINICALKEGILNGKVQFKCPDREEHSQVFDIALKVLPKSVSSQTELVTTVRNTAIHKLSITNPLDKNVTVTTKVENGSDAIFVDSNITILRKSTAEVLIKFFPLIHKEYPPATVTITSAELGTITCKLNLRSIPPGPEKVTRISCPLGQNIIFPLHFTHFCKTNCDFMVRLPSDSKNSPFSKVGTNNTIKVQGTTRAEGQEVIVEIMYEPICVGEIKESIEVFSPQAGSYIFPIVASCIPPQRQGPFLIRPGQSTSIPFKNVFQEPITLSISSDSPNFIVSKASETVGAKKAISIQVNNKADEDENIIQTGKLTVSTVFHGENLQWIYYLKRNVLEASTLSGLPSARREK